MQITRIDILSYVFELVPGHCLSPELPAFENHKLWYLQTQFGLPGERSLPIGLLVINFGKEYQTSHMRIETFFIFKKAMTGQYFQT